MLIFSLVETYLFRPRCPFGFPVLFKLIFNFSHSGFGFPLLYGILPLFIPLSHPPNPVSIMLFAQFSDSIILLFIEKSTANLTNGSISVK